MVLAYLADVLLEDTKHLVQLQLLLPLHGQLLDPVASLQERLQPGLDASSLLPAELLLQPLAQLLQRRQLDPAECTVSFYQGVKSRFIGREHGRTTCRDTGGERPRSLEDINGL